MHADLFAGPGHGVRVLAIQAVDLLAIEMAKAVHDHHRRRGGRRNRLEDGIDFGLRNIGHGHEIGHRLVALLAGVVNHLDGFRHLMGVERHPNHPQHTVFGGNDGGLPITLARIGHGGELQAGAPGVVVTHHASHVLFAAMTPRPKLRSRKQPLGVLVADLHRVDSRRKAGVIDGSDEGVRELMVVDQPTVSDGAVQHFQLWTKGYPRGFRVCTRVITHEVLGPSDRHRRAFRHASPSGLTS